MTDWLRDRVVLVTGGTGSIGTEIVRQLLSLSPRVVRVFSRDETRQYELSLELGESPRLRFLIGDVRDRGRLRRAMEDVDVVFHAAALKHVPLCEYNPFEAVQTNVVGLQNTIDIALEHNVDRFVFISTDKVVNPINAMGATKLLGERLVSAASMYRGRKRTRFAIVRFGNVMASRGSVIPLFLNQIRRGGPVTLTHRDMTRFMMTIPQAVALVMKAAASLVGGETFILKMPTVRIRDLATVLIEEWAPRWGHAPEDVAIQETGIRPGEKIYEELMTAEEAERALEVDDLFVIPPTQEVAAYYERLGARRAGAAYVSQDQEPLSKDRLRELLLAVLGGDALVKPPDPAALRTTSGEKG